MRHSTRRNKQLNTPKETPGTPATQLLFFAQLKEEEQRQFKKKKRYKTAYKDNRSAALALPYSEKMLKQCQKDESRIELTQAQIIEHANRRVDLFFYTLIAYYKKKFLPTIGHTDLQHGIGLTTEANVNLTQACHSSLTPCLLDKTIYENTAGNKKRKSLLSGTDFMQSLNATVELPPVVNHLDDILEEKCRPIGMAILAEVSVGKINPVEGLEQFLIAMHKMLNELKMQAEDQSKSVLVAHSLHGKKGLNPKLIQLVMKGTLASTFSFHSGKVSEAYVQSLLRIKSDNLKLGNEQSKVTLYLEKIVELQGEVLKKSTPVL